MEDPTVSGPVLRLLTSRRTAVFFVGAAGIVGTASVSGGFFAPAWGSSTLAFSLAAAAALLISERLELARIELVSIASLAALTAWAALSVVWSESAPRTALEVQRDLVYVSALAVFLLLATRRGASALAAAALIGSTAVVLWGLSTRLFPDLFGPATLESGRLGEPLGYWNALGIVAAISILLASGVALAERRLPRSVAAAVLPLAAATLYLTFSRGSWVALGLGAGVLLLAAPRRGHAAASLVALAAVSAVAVGVAWRLPALVRPGPRLPDAVSAGHRLALALVVLAAVSAAVPRLLDRLPEHMFPRLPAQVLPAALLIAALSAAAVLVTFGGRAYETFRSPAPGPNDLNARLFSGSGAERFDYWRVAWHDVELHPALGSGGGTFELRWYRERTTNFGARDAHNLYLESVAELGPVGLMLLLAALGAPLVALWRVRSGITAAAGGAYAAFLAHAGLDWDWEMPTVTLTALACGACLLVAARPAGAGRDVSTRLRVAGLIVAAAVAAAAGVAFVGSSAGGRAGSAYSAHDFAAVEQQAKRASRLQPWAAEPWSLLGEAQLASGDREDARVSFRHAVTKDPNDWYPWYELAVASSGAERTRAVAEARRRNPRGPEIAALH
jgi:O-Antigen ligase